MKLHQSKLTGRQRDKEAATGEWEMGEGRVGQHKQPRVGKLLDLGVGYFNQLHRQSNAHSTTDTHTHTDNHTRRRAEQNRREQNRQFKALDTVAERPAGLDVLEKLIK